MKSKIFKRVIAVLLVIIMTLSVVSIQASAFIGQEFLVDKLVEVGMRVAADTCDKISESTEDEQAEALFSFVSKWAFCDGAEAATAKIIKLCEEILDELDSIDQDLKEGLSVVEGMTGENAAITAKKALDSEWNSDVGNIITNANINIPLKAYKKYLSDAVDCSNGEISKSTLESDLNSLTSKFIDISKDNTNINDSKDQKLNAMYCSESTNVAFERVISSLATQLNDSNGGTVYERAGQYAWLSLPFSHQQYQFIYNYAEKQIYEIMLVSMMYNEYLYQQGNYIAEHYDNYIDTNAYKNFLSRQENFGEIMKDTVMPNINSMLNSSIQVSTTESLTLDSLVKPEDYGLVNLNINNYKTKYGFYYNGSRQTYDFYSSSNTIKKTNKFTRVVTRSNNKNHVFYILDPNQFSQKNGTNAIQMDTKFDLSGQSDVHTTSADYCNLTQTKMSDGSNTFSCSKDIYQLFNNNYFRIKGSSPSAYLGSLVPNNTNCTTYLMTSGNKNHFNHVFKTAYADYDVVNLNDTITGTTVNTQQVSGKLFQLDQSGGKYYYTVILKNNDSNENFYSSINIDVPGNIEMCVCDSNNNVLIKNTRNATSSKVTAKAGDTLTFKIKCDDFYTLDKMTCIRHNITDTTTEILDGDNLKLLKKEDGYYIFNYQVPYSNSTFKLTQKTREEDYEITSAEDLIGLSNDVSEGCIVSAKLCCDIDLSTYMDEFSPIGSDTNEFYGTFDGQGHTISGIDSINETDYSGLFGNSQGTIINLNVPDDTKVSECATESDVQQ